MANNKTPPPLDVRELHSMYNIPSDQYSRIISRTVKDFGEPKRVFREVFHRAHVYFMKHKNPSIYTLKLDNVYNKQSFSVISSILRKRGIIDMDGFFTVAFHTAYCKQYQQMCWARDVLVEL